MQNEKISVIFPVFGNFDLRKLRLAVESVRLQDYPNIEIVVSEQNSKPTYQKFARKQGVIYVHSKPLRGKNPYNIGRVRNRGIQRASGTYLYLNDADIIFLRKSFLSSLYRLQKKYNPAYLSFPPMKRLLVSHFDAFHKRVEKNGLEYELAQVSFPDGYTTNTDRRNKLKVLRYGYYGKRYTLPFKDLKKIKKEELEKYGYALLFFTYHAGGTFVEKRNVIDVGGYCEDFYGWGFDDVDLQIRLTEATQKKRRLSIPKKKAYEVLHLDHIKNFKVHEYEKNKNMFEKRRMVNPKVLVQTDRRNIIRLNFRLT